MAALHRGLRRAASRLALMALEETVIGLRSHESAPRSEATMDQTTSTTPVYPQCQECHETALPRTVSLSNGTRTITYDQRRDAVRVLDVWPTGALMSVSVAPGASWAATRRVPVVKEGYLTMPTVDLGRNYDITADGSFLMVKGGSDQTAAPAGITVVQHWGEELKRLVPTQ